MYEYPEESMEQAPVENPGMIIKDGYGYRADDYGHAIDKDGNTTDPYHHLSYVFGFDVEDDSGLHDFLICLDFLVLEAHVAFHAVRDSDSGGYIEDADYYLVRLDEAVEAAGDLAYWAMDQVFDVYYLNVDVDSIDHDNDAGCNETPDEEAFERVRNRFVNDVRRVVEAAPKPPMGYPEDH